MRNPSGKTKAIIAYLTFVGLLIAYFMNKDDRHEFATWHIKNMFGLVILLFIAVCLWSLYLLDLDALMGYFIGLCASKQKARHTVFKRKISILVYFFELESLSLFKLIH